MPEFDIAQFKRTLTAATGPRLDSSTVLREAKTAEGKQRLKNRQAVRHVLQSSLTKAGLDVDTLDKVLAQNQSELRSHFQQQKAAVAKHSSAEREAFRHAVELGYAATQHLANHPRPADVAFGGLSSLVTLSTPFLIWEWPHPTPDQLRDYNIQPLNSYAKILVDIPVYSFDNNSGSDSREFSFFFYWPNETGYLAIVQVFSVLSLNGACELAANAGVFSGDKMELWLDAWLYPIQYWLPVPPGGDLRNLRLQGDPLQHQQVLDDLTAEGGHIFGGAGYANSIFSATPYGLSYGSYGGVSIPANTTAVFEVTLRVGYQWSGNTLPDEIKADFADNNLHYYVGCPLVVLQFLTAPPVMA